MNSASSLGTIYVALEEIQRKLQELERIEASLVLESPLGVNSSVEVITTEYECDPNLEDAVETVRLWCTHVSHVMDRYLHPSLGRLFMDDANGRLTGRSRQDFRVTIRWIQRATKQILRDTVEHGNRIHREDVSLFQGRALLTSRSLASRKHIAGHPHYTANPIDNWTVTGPPDVNASVFVIHGHDEAARDDLEGVLSRRYVVRTVVMYTKMVPTVTLPEKFEHCARDCNLAIALLTPDDVGGKLGSDSASARVRQNVLVELGWFWGRCGLHNVLLLSPGKLELPSDLGGLQIVRYEHSVEEAISAIDAFMHFHKVRLRDEKVFQEKRAPRKRLNRTLQSTSRAGS